MNNSKGFFSLLACGLILAIFGLLVKILNQYIGNFTQAGMRMLLAGIIIFPFLFKQKISFKISRINPLLFLVLVLSFPLYIAFFTISINNTKIVNSFFYLFTSTMLTSYALGYFFFKEKINLQKIVVAIVSIFGLLMFILPFNSNKGFIGEIAGIIGGILYGISNATRKYYANKINRWLVIFCQMISGAIISFPFVYFLKESSTNHWVFDSVLFIILFAIGLVLIQVLLFTGFANFKLNLGSIVLASQLVFVQAIGIIILHEFPTTLEIIGSLLIATSVIFSNIEIKGIIKQFKY